MAYLCGLVTKEQKAQLERRGWEFEAPPNELRPDEIEDNDEYVMVHVDNDLFSIMDGPDWEKSEMTMKRKLVTLCGSTRFKTEFEEAVLSEGMDGNVVLTVSCFGHADNIDHTEDQKKEWDLLHLYKISISDEILVINRDGYVGDSTKSEIAFAVWKHKVIRWLRPIEGERFLEDNSHELGRLVAAHAERNEIL